MPTVPGGKSAESFRRRPRERRLRLLSRAILLISVLDDVAATLALCAGRLHELVSEMQLINRIKPLTVLQYFLSKLHGILRAAAESIALSSKRNYGTKAFESFVQSKWGCWEETDNESDVS